MKTHKWPPHKKSQASLPGIHPAFRRLPPNPISLDKPPIRHPRGKDGTKA